MSPFSKERANYIEERLFVLGRISGELHARGSLHGNRINLQAGDYASIHAAILNTNAERLQLIAERQVIEDFFLDNPTGTIGR